MIGSDIDFIFLVMTGGLNPPVDPAMSVTSTPVAIVLREGCAASMLGLLFSPRLEIFISDHP